MDRNTLQSTQVSTRLNLFFICSLFTASYVGARMPSLWSVNYYVPSFFEGFFRRGLIGTLLYPFGELRFNYHFISAIQIAVLVLLLLMVVCYVYRADIQRKILFILFFLAPTGGYVFHLIGYSDQLLYLLLIVSLSTHRRWVGLVLMVASLFIHEEALFVIIPIYFVYLLAHRVSARLLLTHMAVIGFAFLLLTLFLQTVDLFKIEHFIQKIMMKFGPLARNDYYLTFNNYYTSQALTNTFMGLHGEPEHSPQGSYDFLYFEIVIISILACLIAKQYINKDQTLWYNLCCFLMVVVAAIAPLFLVFVGIDAERWVFLSISSCLFLFCLIKRPLSWAHFISIAFTFLLFLAHGKLWYFDGRAPRAFEKPNVIFFWKSTF